MNQAVSFVIPVRNDARRLDVCLRGIGKNGVAGRDLEIVVIDNGSTDGSAEVARGHGARVIPLPGGPVSSLRNQGAALAGGRVLAFVDADNEIGQGWLDAALENLRVEGVAATGALYAAPAGGAWVQRAYGLLRGRSEVRKDCDWLGAGNLAVHRDAFDAVQGFDVTLEACEDVDFCQRLRATGQRLLADPRLVSVHHGDPSTLKALFVAERWRGRDNLKVTLRPPVAWREVPTALIPVADIVLLLASVAGGAAGLAGITAGWFAMALALTCIALGSLARAAWAWTRQTRHDAAFPQLFAVALVYDLARALATVTRAPHRNTVPRAALTAP